MQKQGLYEPPILTTVGTYADCTQGALIFKLVEGHTTYTWE